MPSFTASVLHACSNLAMIVAAAADIYNQNINLKKESDRQRESGSQPPELIRSRGDNFSMTWAPVDWTMELPEQFVLANRGRAMWEWSSILAALHPKTSMNP